MISTWNFPTPTRFGAGAIRSLPVAATELGIRRPLLVTDPTLAQLPPVRAALEAAAEADLPVAVFHEISRNPTEADVLRGVAAYRTKACDGVIALGGGAALDTGKAVGLMVGQRRPLFDFEDIGDNHTRVDPDGMAPVVAVPTTSGTGSEVGRASVIVDTEAKVKRIVFHPRMLPGRVICDPELTLGLPAPVTAAVGMDALSHNLEAFCAPGFHPMADGIAAQGIALIKEALPHAVADGGDLEARSQMMAASTMGAVAFQKGLGAMHALSHPLGAVYDAHHGLLNAIVMPYVLAFNRPAIQARATDLARALDLPSPSFDAFLTWICDLRETLGIPHTLKGIGLTPDAIPTLARLASQDASGATNPVPLSAGSLEGLLERALSGNL